MIGEGGFGAVYKAKHARFGTVVYKELNARRLGDRYAQTVLIQRNSITEQLNSVQTH